MADPIQQGNGQMTPTDMASAHNRRQFQIDQSLQQIVTSKLVKVVAVYDSNMNPVDPSKTGQVGPSGYVDVQPLVGQVDGENNVLDHGTIFGIPFSRVQGGQGAVICDPQVGDIGQMDCFDRDTTAVLASRENPAPGPPGSLRQHDAADGVYKGPIGQTPSQWVRFRADGMEVVDKNGNIFRTDATGWLISDSAGNYLQCTTADGQITANCVTFQINGSLKCTGEADFQGEVVGNLGGGGGSVGLTTHVHTQPNDSHGDTEQPVSPPIGGT